MSTEEILDKLEALAKLTCRTPEWTHITATVVQAIEHIARQDIKLAQKQRLLDEIGQMVSE